MISFTWDDSPDQYDDISLVNSLCFNPPITASSANHLFIQGDNYPVLQKLLPEYASSVDLIYIDPPYNTGNAFAYNDKFFTGSKYASSKAVDRHSSWLSFMNRRLKLAQQFLAETGCIFIAIDQSELYTLKLLCDTIFGEENFVNDFMWLHGKGKKDTWSRTLQQHTLCYAKDKKQLKPFAEVELTSWATKNPDNDPRGNWFSGSISFSEKRSNPQHKNYFSIKSPSGITWIRQWMCTKEEMDNLLKENKIYFGPAPFYKGVPRVKIFNNTPETIIPKNIIDCVESTRHAQAHVDNLLGEKGLFDNPKPVSLISHLIQITQQKKDALIMDFFAGSGTTFEAVCQLNKNDGGNRRCILIQKPEISQKTNQTETIADLCWKRIQKNSLQYNQSCEKSVLSDS